MSLAFVFPGQGSQSIGMLNKMALQFPQVEEVFTEASEVLAYDLWKLVSQGATKEINQTDRTQPVMLAAGIAILTCWQARSERSAEYYAGHSLGEYTALVAAGALSFQDAIKLVAQRGKLMQDAVPNGEGAMAAIIGLDDYKVKALCVQASKYGVVETANFNSPDQIVISGATNAVNKAIEIAKDKGARRVLLLPVSVPSHCSLMKSAAESLGNKLTNITIQSPRVPVIHNTHVRTSIKSNEIKVLLTKQLYNPVRWVETVQLIAQKKITTIIECGPGKVLTGLVKRIDKSLTVLPVFDPITLEEAISSLGKSK